MKTLVAALTLAAPAMAQDGIARDVARECAAAARAQGVAVLSDCAGKPAAAACEIDDTLPKAICLTAEGIAWDFVSLELGDEYLRLRDEREPGWDRAELLEAEAAALAEVHDTCLSVPADEEFGTADCIARRKLGLAEAWLRRLKFAD
ncbi:hypothetical protein EF888_13605 [Silicimonas algicola]|uniref:Lysozyme inhibitor LprI N-terminal domain-containing protein n=1 Tax=Silicimonas algicola TaxID=1826607 RepID=A0A316G9B6_9RHOB|nr:hypothetical protein [Silicimonas algicola]AZQ68077.1 hypothetical protein EF888_13605 [Silicimonas algicola]PWK57468.1 hypothetical protein C8D95_102111 [Silicimonas algicola]